MLYFIGVMLLWFLVRLYCRIVSVDLKSQPYELNRIYLDPYESSEQASRSFANIKPLDEIELDAAEVRRVLVESRRLSKTI